MEKIGFLNEFGDNPLFRIYYTEDYSKLYYKDFTSTEHNELPIDQFWNVVDKELEKIDFSIEDRAEGWAIECNSPWSKDAMYEESFINSDGKYQIEKVIIVYDYIEVGIIGFGNSEEEARKDLERKEKSIQKNFNKNNTKI